jgi:uncharacterized membrane protein (DUF373 family)
MRLKDQLTKVLARWENLTFYQRFEQSVILVLAAIIAVVIVLAVWSLALKVLFGLVLPGSLDPTDYGVFQAVFGMIFTVIIALEFEKSLLVIAQQRISIVQVKTVVLIALLAVVRKLMILDLSTTDAMHLFALAAAILALGSVYSLVREQDRRENIGDGTQSLD